MNFALGGDRTHDSCIRGKRLSARPQGSHSREQTTPRLILKYLEIIFHKGTNLIKIKFLYFKIKKNQTNNLSKIYKYEKLCEILEKLLVNFAEAYIN